jgi:hypothetical protein
VDQTKLTVHIPSAVGAIDVDDPHAREIALALGTDE